MAAIELRERVRALRKQGESIGEISRILRANKSTVSYWCRDISLSRSQLQKIAERQRAGGALGRLRAAEMKRAERLRAIESEARRGAKDVGTIGKRDIFMLGLALYWGEGYKSANDECGLTNSDPRIIRAYIEWLQQIYGEDLSNLILRVSINGDHKHRVDRVEQYWSKVTRIPRSQFTKTSLIRTRAKKVYANADEHFGTLRVKVRRGTTLRRRILGSIAEVSRQFYSINRNSRNIFS